MKGKITVLFFFLLLPTLLFAGTVGKIKGKVTDLKTGEPLIGASVVVTGSSLGATTSATGEFVILNLVAGNYTLKASYIGYQSITISNIRVNSDLTTEINFDLPAEGIQISEISVVAVRPLVNKNNTNANRITTGDDINALPVRGVDNIIALTPGVVLQDRTVFIRGGRQDEVGFYLEGASISDPVVGGRAVSIVQDAVEEIQVQAGGYTAEFGGANAGIIRQQFKTGTNDFKATVEFVTDNISAKKKADRFDGKQRLGAYWYGYSELSATLSGPVVDKRLKFFGVFNHNYQTDKNPQSYPGVNLGMIKDPTTGDSINMVYNAGALVKNSLESYTGTGTLSLDLNPVLIRLIGTYTNQKTFNPFSSVTVAGNFANMLDQDRIEQVKTNNGAFSLKATHLLDSKTFYEISVGYAFNSLNRADPYLGDNFLRYGDSAANAAVGFTWPGQYTRPVAKSIYIFSFNAPGDVIAGYQKFKREDLTINGSFSTEMFKDHAIKIGGELQMFTIRNWSLGNRNLLALASSLDINAALADGDPNKMAPEELIYSKGVNNYGYDAFGNETSGKGGLTSPKKPVFASAYIQDKIEYKDLVINAGLRFDYFNIDNKMFKDETRPELAINKNTGAIYEDGLVDVPTFSSVSPRVGFSFPVTDQTVFHAQYGKFVQQSRLRDVYQGIYATSYNLRGGYEITAPVGFNIRPTRTTQYEVGFTQQVGDFASIDITGYYKDIQDQIVYDQVKVADGSPFGAYAILKNGDFATTKGVEIAFNMRRKERFQINATLAFQDAQGTGSFPNSNRGIVGAPLDGVTVFKPQYISPLEYNNAVRGNINIDYRFGKDDGPKALEMLGVSLLMKFNSGHPYTLGKGGASLEADARDRQPLEPANSSTTPAIFQVDLRIDKTFNIFDKLNANIYVYVINVFDRRNAENVFLRTGSPVDDGYLSDPNGGLQLARTLGQQFVNMYNAMYLQYYDQWQSDVSLAPYTTNASMYGPPRQIRFGIRLEY